MSDDLEQRVEDTMDLAKQAMEYAGDAQEQVEELEEENERLRERIHELEKENECLRDQEQMFQDVRQNLQRTPKERAADKLGVNNWTVTNDAEKIMMKGELLDKDGGDIQRIK